MRTQRVWIRVGAMASSLGAMFFVGEGAAHAKGKGGGGGGGLLNELFIKNDRSVVNVATSFGLFREADSYPDTVLGVQVNFAPIKYFNVELGVGGYHERIPEWTWNGFGSYIAASIAYVFTTMAGKNIEYHELRDPLLVKIRDRNNPYKNVALWGGGYAVPFPSLKYQPQFGMHVMQLDVKNKGSNLRTVSSLRAFPTIAIEKRNEETYTGVRAHFGPKDANDTYLQGVSMYAGLDL